MYQGERPTCVNVIDWVWIILGIGFVGQGVIVLPLISRALRETHQNISLMTVIFPPEIIPFVPFLVIASIGVGALGIVSGINFIKLKSWARAILEVLSWLFFAYMTVSGAFWVAVVCWIGVTSVVMGAFGLVLCLVFYGVPLGIMLKHLRGEKVRNAISNTAEPIRREERLTSRTEYPDGAGKLESLAKNPGSPPSLLKELSVHQNRELRIEVARNPNTPPSVLEELSKDTDSFVRMLVASHPLTPPEIRAKLSEDPNVTVREAVASNLLTSPEIMAKLQEDPAEGVRYIARRKSREIPGESR